VLPAGVLPAGVLPAGVLPGRLAINPVMIPARAAHGRHQNPVSQDSLRLLRALPGQAALPKVRKTIEFSYFSCKT